MTWQVPTELPDLRRVDIIAPDTETLEALVEPIIRNIAAGSIAIVVHHRRGAE